MRRAAPAAGLLALIVGIVGCGLIRWPVSASLVSAGLDGAPGGSGGLRWTLPEAATFRALPWPHLRFYGARLKAFGSDLVAAPEAQLELSLSDLLRGRIVATRAALTRPIVTIDLGSAVFAGEDRPGRALRARLAVAPLANVTLTNGVVRVIDARHGFDTVLDDVHGQLDGLELSAPLSANLSAVWRETPITVWGSLESLDSVAGKDGAGLNVAVSSPVGKLTLTGALTGGATGLAGRLSFSSGAAGALARLLGLTVPPYLAADAFSFDSKLRSGLDGVTLDDATIGVAGQTLEGAMRIADYRGRAVVSGTLDAERLSAGALFGTPAPWRESGGAWTDRPFTAAPPTTFDVDVRLSAGTLDVYGHALENAAASLLLKSGELTATLIEATVYAGKIEGEARFARQEAELDLHARATLTDADLGAALADWGWRGFTGHGAAELSLATRGAAPDAAIVHMTGAGALRAGNGAIPNINLEEALRRSQRRPLDVSRDLRAGQTAFDRIELEILIGDGVAHIAKGDLASRGVLANLGGSVDLAKGNLNLRVEATQADSNPTPRLTFEVAGPWSSPAIAAQSAPSEPESPQSAPP